MKKITLLLLLATSILIGQTRYDTKAEALNGKVDSSADIQQLVNETGIAVLDAGWYYLNESIYLYKKRDAVVGSGQGNKGINFIVDRGFKVFRPVSENTDLIGFTVHSIYTGTDKVEVVYIGAEHIGVAGLNADNSMYHIRPNKTTILGSTFDFDVIGDKYNSNVIPFTVDYSNTLEDDVSHFHFTKIRGYWKWINLGIKINRRVSTQSMNTLDIDVYIAGYNKMADIKGINFSKIRIMGQLLKNTGELFYIEGAQLNCDIFTYTEHWNFSKGNYHVTDLNLSGYFDILPYPAEVQCLLNNSTIRE